MERLIVHENTNPTEGRRNWLDTGEILKRGLHAALASAETVVMCSLNNLLKSDHL
jgi:hypothetical protein